MWTKTQHKKAQAFVIGLGARLGVTGRGRCSQEGLNCTLTGSPEGVRQWCGELRKWNPLFLETDFKLTCKTCHTSMKGAYPVKADAVATYKKLQAWKAPAGSLQPLPSNELLKALHSLEQ